MNSAKTSAAFVFPIRRSDTRHSSRSSSSPPLARGGALANPNQRKRDKRQSLRIHAALEIPQSSGDRSQRTKGLPASSERSRTRHTSTKSPAIDLLVPRKPAGTFCHSNSNHRWCAHRWTMFEISTACQIAQTWAGVFSAIASRRRGASTKVDFENSLQKVHIFLLSHLEKLQEIGKARQSSLRFPAILTNTF